MTLKSRSLSTLALTSALVFGSTGCSVKWGFYKAADFEHYRERAAEEPVDIAVEDERPIQNIIEEGVGYQGIPVTLSLGPGSPVTWEDLEGALSLYELKGKERIASFETVLLPYTHNGTSKLGEYRTELASEGMADARALGRQLLSEMQERRGDGPVVFFLVCRQPGVAEPCLQYGRRYDLVVAPSPRNPRAGESGAIAPVASYPFRLERKSNPVTKIAGIVVLIVFLGASAG